jgi:hypothetical protein
MFKCSELASYHICINIVNSQLLFLTLEYEITMDCSDSLSPSIWAIGEIMLPILILIHDSDWCEWYITLFIGCSKEDFS